VNISKATNEFHRVIALALRFLEFMLPRSAILICGEYQLHHAQSLPSAKNVSGAHS
jgi:hypothetical protein